MIAAIIPAGGVGQRFGTREPKQFYPLLGKAIILWTLEAFEGVPEIDLLVIPCLSSYQSRLEELIQQARFEKEIKIVPGGRTRQESVKQGLVSLPEETEIVLVHDAARPLVSTELIKEVIQGVRSYGAAIAACPARDTVKRVRDLFVSYTIPREEVYLAQTPQGARYELLRYAFERAEKDRFQGTDEASLLERVNIPVFVIPAPITNLKITTPEDLKVAEALLRGNTF